MSISATTHTTQRVYVRSHSDVARYWVPIGRLLFSAVFLMAVPGHFTAAEIQQAANHGLPFANVLVPLSGLVALFGALSVLLGYHARFGAGLLALFLIPVTLVMHAFWGVADPMQAQLQQIMFMKNVALLGTTLILMHMGAGPISFDERARRRVVAGRS